MSSDKDGVEVLDGEASAKNSPEDEARSQLKAGSSTQQSETQQQAIAVNVEKQSGARGHTETAALVWALKDITSPDYQRHYFELFQAVT